MCRGAGPDTLAPGASGIGMVGSVVTSPPVQLCLLEWQPSESSDSASVIRRTLGRPRALSLQALEQVLSLSREGLGTRAIATAMREAGVNVSRPTIQRALRGRGAYARPDKG